MLVSRHCSAGRNFPNEPTLRVSCAFAASRAAPFAEETRGKTRILVKLWTERETRGGDCLSLSLSLSFSRWSKPTVFQRSSSSVHHPPLPSCVRTFNKILTRCFSLFVSGQVVGVIPRLARSLHIEYSR